MLNALVLASVGKPVAYMLVVVVLALVALTALIRRYV
jgi:hypothetical protein